MSSPVRSASAAGGAAWPLAFLARVLRGAAGFFAAFSFFGAAKYRSKRITTIGPGLRFSSFAVRSIFLNSIMFGLIRIGLDISLPCPLWAATAIATALCVPHLGNTVPRTKPNLPLSTHAIPQQERRMLHQAIHLSLVGKHSCLRTYPFRILWPMPHASQCKQIANKKFGL